MKKALSLFLVVALVGSLFVGGAAAHSDYQHHDKKKHHDTKKHHDKKKHDRKKHADTTVTQKANSQVWQTQHVDQKNYNSQKSVAVSVTKYTKTGGDATVTQQSFQANANAQVTDSEAENEAEH